MSGEAKRPQPDPGALIIRPPGGYQYGDDHPWAPADQARLVKRLGRLLDSLTGHGSEEET